MSDYMLRATAANDTIRAFAITAKDTIEEARRRHDTAPVVTAALGRLLCGGAMMCMMEKEDEGLLTLQVLGDGPVGGITVSASPDGLLKGFANETNVELPLKYPGKLDVGTAVGSGILRVMREQKRAEADPFAAAGEPYIGTVELVSGEIAEDLTYYFAQSEQTPSAVGLGVLVDKDITVRCAGGFIVQLMPDVTDEAISLLEQNIQSIRPVTELLDEGMMPEGLLEELLKGMDVTVLEKRPVAYRCDCSRERVTKSLAALPKEDLQEMIDDAKPVEVRCQFCNEKYEFAIEELKKL
ncbi:MAG: Hsp33 family molecular chaperone HslO [Lachnospiraceae bacterium]|nr:Hsp33 family molecular chaperone HslO [Lachnospiraceae bacterium]